MVCVLGNAWADAHFGLQPPRLPMPSLTGQTSGGGGDTQASGSGGAGQDQREKRKLRQDYRSLIGSAEEARGSLADHNPMQLSQMIRKGTDLYERVRAPTESVLDSRFLLNASEIGTQMARNLKIDTGFEIDDYLKRVASLIGGTLQAASRNALLDDEEDDEGGREEGWDWQALGRRAAKRTKRAPTLDFLLGPLAVEDKKRNVARRAPAERSGPVVKPQQLNEDDIVKSENETTRLVREISQRLQVVGGEDGINFFQFVVDPASFSNTVENIFYVSFLVRDGGVSIEDRDGEPMLTCVEQPTPEDYAAGLTKQQLVMELDMATWRELVDVYGIQTAVIPSRAAQANGDTWTR